MITLITGVPGTGKTALVVKMIAELKGSRPLFVMGIRDLKVEHQPVPPVEQWTERRAMPEDPSLTQPYFTFPANSLIVIDECQNIYRPRPSGSKVPDFVAANETHRHTGVDFILLTQHPTLLDANVRKFISRHIHIRQTPLGRFKHEWTELGDVDSTVSRSLSRRDKYKPPKSAFPLYKSAEMHTKVKVRLPWYVYLFFLTLVVGSFVAWRVYSRINEVGLNGKQLPLISGDLASPKSGHDADKPKTALEYLAQYQPRFVAKPETAPAYDKLTEPKVVPEPAVCYESQNTGCKCQTQQGTTYETTQDHCREIIKTGGDFKPWKEPQHVETARLGPADTRGETPDRQGLPVFAAPRYIDSASL